MLTGFFSEESVRQIARVRSFRSWLSSGTCSSVALAVRHSEEVAEGISFCWGGASGLVSSKGGTVLRDRFRGDMLEGLRSAGGFATWATVAILLLFSEAEILPTTTPFFHADMSDSTSL